MRSTLFALLLATVLTGGCSVTTTVAVPTPGGMKVTTNTITAPMIGSEAMGYSEDALATRVSLVRVDAEATCFDVLLPLPSDGKELTVPLDLHAEIDDVDAAVVHTSMSECSARSSCLPGDSPLLPFATGPDGEVLTLGQRVCFEKLPPARRSVSLARRGLFAWRFRFVFQG